MHSPEFLESLKRSDRFRLQKTKPLVSAVYGSEPVKPIFTVLVDKFGVDQLKLNGTVTISIDGFDQSFLTVKENRPPLSAHLGNFPSVSNAGYISSANPRDFDRYVEALIEFSETLPSSIEELSDSLNHGLVGDYDLKYFRGREADFNALRLWLSSRSSAAAPAAG